MYSVYVCICVYVDVYVCIYIIYTILNILLLYIIIFVYNCLIQLFNSFDYVYVYGVFRKCQHIPTSVGHPVQITAHMFWYYIQLNTNTYALFLCL